MHPDLSPILHTPECNKLIEALKDCHSNKKFGKFLGQCNDIDKQLNRCLKEERKNNQRINREKSLAKQKRVSELQKAKEANSNPK